MFFSIFVIKQRVAVPKGFRARGILAAWCRAIGGIGCLAATTAHCLGQGSSRTAGTVGTVVYVSEVPYQWNSEMGNPLEIWERKLSTHRGLPVEGPKERIKNLIPVLTWEKLQNLSKTKTDHLFAVHGYEYVANRSS